MPSSIHQAYPKRLASVLTFLTFSSLSNLPNQCIYLHAVHIVQLLQRLFDLPLVRLYIADENQGIILLNFLHRTLGVERIYDDFVVV